MNTWQRLDGSVCWPDWPDECSCGAELPDVCDGNCPDCGEPYIHLISQPCDECGQLIHPDADYWLNMDGGDVICLDCAAKTKELSLLMAQRVDTYTVRTQRGRAFFGPDVYGGYALRYMDYAGKTDYEFTAENLDMDYFSDIMRGENIPFDGWVSLGEPD